MVVAVLAAVAGPAASMAVPASASAQADVRELAYVANRDADTVSVINVATGAVVSTIPVGPGPLLVAVTPDGTRAYVTNWKYERPATIRPHAKVTQEQSFGDDSDWDEEEDW